MKTRLAQRFPAYEPGNATSYDITLVLLVNNEVLIALWPNLSCSTCMKLDIEIASADPGALTHYVSEKLRVSPVDADAILALVVPEALELAKTQSKLDAIIPVADASLWIWKTHRSLHGTDSLPPDGLVSPPKRAWEAFCAALTALKETMETDHA